MHNTLRIILLCTAHLTAYCEYCADYAHLTPPTTIRRPCYARITVHFVHILCTPPTIFTSKPFTLSYLYAASYQVHCREPTIMLLHIYTYIPKPPSHHPVQVPGWALPCPLYCGYGKEFIMPPPLHLALGTTISLFEKRYKKLLLWILSVFQLE